MHSCIKGFGGWHEPDYHCRFPRIESAIACCSCQAPLFFFSVSRCLPRPARCCRSGGSGGGTCCWERASGLLLDEGVFRFHNPSPQYLWNARSMSSEFLRGCFRPRNGVKCPYVGGYTNVDQPCRSSLTGGAEAAVFQGRQALARCETKRPQSCFLRHNCVIVDGVTPFSFPLTE